jgi:hypothetical protein
LIHQLPRATTFTYKLYLEHTIACWKDINEKKIFIQGLGILMVILICRRDKKHYFVSQNESIVWDQRNYIKIVKVGNYSKSVEEVGGL